MKSILTGSNGYIGKELSKRLLKLNHEVKVIPRNMFYSYYELKKYLEFERPDYIFHLAAYGNRSDQTDENQIFYANVEGTWRLLKASQDVNYKMLVNISSSSVQLPYKTLYASSKECGESLAMSHAIEHNKNIVSVRPSTVTGKGDDNHLISALVRSCRFDETIPFVGEATHDFIDISDFISGLLTIIDSNRQYRGDVFNISNNLCHSNTHVKNLVEKVLGKSANLDIVTNLRKYDSKNWVVNNAKLLSLGWKPKIVLSEIVKSMAGEI